MAAYQAFDVDEEEPFSPEIPLQNCPEQRGVHQYNAAGDESVTPKRSVAERPVRLDSDITFICVISCDCIT